ncbi:MAG: LuxR C-terminal-related transcriptional regulator, partial [Thermomicrobiales bacterium]
PLRARLLRRAPRFTAMVTTRQVLHVDGAHEFPMAPLPLPPRNEEISVEALAQFAPIRLFADRARLIDPAFELTAGNASDVLEICHLVDGLPLGIELAAAQLTLFSPEMLRDHMASHREFLLEGSRDQPRRLQTMRNAILWSYELLTPREQHILHCASVFSGGFTLDALQSIAGEGDDVSAIGHDLASVIEASLIQKEHGVGTPRFSMLETIRHFALESMPEEKRDELQDRHGFYYLTLAAEAESRLIVVGSAGWVQRLQHEHGNLREAVRWAFHTGKPELVLALSGTLLSMAYARGEPAESLNWLLEALEHPGEASSEVIADALFTASALAQVQGNLPESQRLATKSQHVARQARYRFGEARALIGLGISDEWANRLDEAATHYREAMLIMQQDEQSNRLSHWRVLPQANLADIALLQHRFAEAIELGSEAVARWREAGYLWGIAQALGTVAAAQTELGHLKSARDAWSESLDLWIACADGRGLAGTIAGIAGLSLVVGNAESAATLLGASESVRSRLGVQFVAHHLYAQRQIERARSRLDHDTFEQRWNEGARASVETAIELSRDALESVSATHSSDRGEGLSQREMAVLRLVAAGLPDREIAEALVISPRTVHSHMTGIFTKLNARSRAEAVAIAARQGLV